MHQILVKKQSIKLFHIHCSEEGDTNLIYGDCGGKWARSVKFKLAPETKEYQFKPREALRLETNSYYIPETPNLHTVDSFAFASHSPSSCFNSRGTRPPMR